MKSKFKSLCLLFTIILFTAFSLSAKDKAPVTIKKEITISTNIANAWEVLGPQFADAYKWASSLKHSEASDHNSFNGSKCTERSCSIKGLGNTKEKLIKYSETEHTISYHVYEGMPKMVKYATNTWVLTDLGNDQTKVEISLVMKTGGLMGGMMKGMMRKKMSKLAVQIVEEFKYYVETGNPHPRKVKSAKK